MAAALVALIVAAALIGARTYFHGPFLARLVRAQLNPRLAGAVDTTSIEWGVLDALRGGGKLPVTLHHVKLVDRTHDETVLELPAVEATIDVWALLAPGGHRDILIDRVAVRGGTAVIRMHRRPEDAEKEYELNLAAAFRARVPVPPRPGAIGPLYVLHGVVLEDVDLTLDFPSWRADIRGIDSLAQPVNTAWLSNSTRDPENPEFDFGVPVRADSATLRLGKPGSPYVFELRELDVQRLTIPPGSRNRFEYDLVATSEEGSGLHAVGALWIGDGQSGVDLDLRVDNAGPLAAKHSDGHVAGGQMEARLRALGTWDRGPVLTVEASGAEVQDEPGARVDHLLASLDLGTGLVTIGELLASTLDGQAFAGGTIQLPTRDEDAAGEAAPATPAEPPRFDLALEVRRPLDLSPWVPADVARHTGSRRLSGGLRVSGTTDDLRAEGIDLTLGSARVTGAVHVKDGGAIAEPHGLTVAYLGARATASGSVDVERGRLDLQVSLAAGRLAPLLRHFDVPPLARGVSGRGRVGGSFDDPTASGSLSFRGVELVDEVDARLAWRKGVLDVRELHGRPLGGELNGSGQVTFGRDGQPVLRGFNVAAAMLDLSRIPGMQGVLSGVAHFRLDAEGALGPLPDGELSFGADDFRLAGWGVGDARSQVTFGGQAVTIHSLHVGGARGGLDVVGELDLDAGLDLDVTLHDLPLATLPWLQAPPDGLGVEGRASLEAKVAGTLDRPEIAGVLNLRGVSLRDTILGAAPIKLEPWPDGRVHFHGKLFQGKYDLDGWLSLEEPFALEARLGFRRVELEEFVALGTFIEGAHGWVSGEATVKIGEDGLKARLQASEVALYLDATDDEGRPTPIAVRNVGEIDVTWDGVTARLAHPIELSGPTSSFKMAGSASARALDLSFQGRVDLALLDLYTRRYFDDARGTALLDLTLRGTPAKPEPTGFVELRGAVVRLRGQDVEVGVPAGRLAMGPDRVEVQDLVVEADHQRMHVNGHVSLADFVPDRVKLKLRGRLPARLLELVPGRALSSAGGSASITLNVDGAAINPDITGLLTFDGPFAVVPRGLRHDVILSSGQVRFSNQEIAMRRVKGQVDDSPLALTGDPGRCDAEGFCPALRLYQWSPIDVYLGLRVNGLNHKVPQVLDVELNAAVALSGDMESLQLRGDLEIVDGQYIQPFKWQDYIVPVRTAERSTPFWKGNPLLENVNLALLVRTVGSFRVRNNIAKLVLDGEVEITGTPARPRLDRQILVREGGTFKSPFMRATFTLTSGNVTFSWTQPFPDETPSIDLLFNTDFRDAADKDHKVRLRVAGTLKSLGVDWETDTGLRGAQVVALLTTRYGDANDFVRGSSSAQTGNAVPSATGSRGDPTMGGVVDNFMKEVSGDLLPQLIEDPLRNALPAWIRLDCIRIAPGTESLRVNLCKNLTRRLRIDWDQEEGYDRGSRWTLSGRWQLLDTVAIEGRYIDDSQAEEDRRTIEDKGRIGVRWRFVLP